MYKTYSSKSYDPGRTRTCNLLIRSQAPYPLGHGTDVLKECELLIQMLVLYNLRFVSEMFVF